MHTNKDDALQEATQAVALAVKQAMDTSAALNNGNLTQALINANWLWQAANTAAWALAAATEDEAEIERSRTP